MPAIFKLASVTNALFVGGHTLCICPAVTPMGGDTRLNLLLTHEEHKPFAGQPWYHTLNHLLAPMGVKTFEATSGQQAVELIERHPIHLAVVDSRLPAISGLNVLQLIQKL